MPLGWLYGEAVASETSAAPRGRRATPPNRRRPATAPADRHLAAEPGNQGDQPPRLAREPIGVNPAFGRVGRTFFPPESDS